MTFKELVEYAKTNKVIAYVDNDCISFYPDNENDDEKSLLELSPGTYIEYALEFFNIQAEYV